MGEDAIQIWADENEFHNAIFKPTSWRKKIDFTKRLIQNNNVLISILGREKSGKTTYANLLQVSLAPKIKTYIITANSSFNNRSFLQQIGLTLHIAGEPTFANFISYTNEQQSHTLLIIDDAHFLSPEFIDSILDGLKNQNSSRHFHVCLISNYTILPQLNEFAGNSYPDMIHSMELGALTESETKSYVVQQLLAVSGIDKLITDERLKQFYALTEGYLLQMNKQFTSFFGGLEHLSAPPLRNDKSARLATAGICILLAVFGVACLLKASAPKISITKKQRPILVNIATPELPISSFIPAYFDMAKYQVMSTAPAKKAELIIAKAPAAHIETVIPVIDKVLVAPKQLQPVKNKLLIHKTAAKVLPKNKNYTIQVMGSYDKQRLKRFLTIYKLKGRIWATTKKHGKIWYVLTIGQYKENEFAHIALQKLPKEISQYKPWVRTIENMRETG